MGQKTYGTYEGTTAFLKGRKSVSIVFVNPNTDPDPGQPKECGSGSTTLPAIPCPGVVEPVEPLELVVPELELSLPHELWLLGLLNKLGPVFQHPEVKQNIREELGTVLYCKHQWPCFRKNFNSFHLLSPIKNEPLLMHFFRIRIISFFLTGTGSFFTK
jgi:hypothetical protein